MLGVHLLKAGFPISKEDGAGPKKINRFPYLLEEAEAEFSALGCI